MSFTVSRETDMLIAGYGGSGNTYATAAFHSGQPDKNLAHHLHAAAQVVRAVQLQVPCMVLIRHPADSISSLTSRGGPEFSFEGQRAALMKYSNFYNAIIHLSDNFVTCSFKEVVDDYAAAINRVNEKFSTSFRVPETGSEESKEIVRRNKTKGTHRMCAIEDVKEFLNSEKLRSYRLKAENSYERFCARTNTLQWQDPARPPVTRRADAPEKAAG